MDVDERRGLRDMVAAYLSDRYDDQERRRLLTRHPSELGPHWPAFASDLGLLALGFPEQLGGLGGTAIEHGLVMEEFGSALVTEPYLATVVIGGGFLKRSSMEGAPALIAKLISGDCRLAFAHSENGDLSLRRPVTATLTDRGFIVSGSKSVVVGAPVATHLIVSARTDEGTVLLLVDKASPGIHSRDYRTISGAAAADVSFDHVMVPSSMLVATKADANALTDAVMDEATAVLCAESIGVMARLLEDTVSYTLQRRQFGNVLASYQALQHRMADMLIAKEQSAAITAEALASLSLPSTERGQMVSAAKVFVSRSIRFVGQQAVQLHGGMGMTDELALGSFFKRATEIGRQFGSVDHHLARFEALAYEEREHV